MFAANTNHEKQSTTITRKSGLLNYDPSLLDLLDEIAAIAQLGLNYTKDPHDRLRYDRLLEITSTQYADLSGLPSQAIKERFTKELGYITPKLGVQGALFNEEGLLLLGHRSDDHLWGLPAGWAEVGERPEQTIVREFREETALIVEPTNILGFYTRLPGEYDQPHTFVHILYLCQYGRRPHKYPDRRRQHCRLGLCRSFAKTSHRLPHNRKASSNSHPLA